VTAGEPAFLTLAEVVQIHHEQIEQYGGRAGVRDMGLLQSALAAPRASAGGAYAHRDLFAMAAAYAFHLVKNHPFVDGNKRTALVSALLFLELNGVSVLDPGERLYDPTLRLAMGESTREDFAALLRKLPKEQTRRDNQ
jgi:death on curing protein